jgi:hypothetical protein
MTQDEIIDMAMEAEFVSHGKPSEEESELFVCTDKDIVRFAKLVAAKEREACALICERVYKRMCPEAQENEVGIEAETIRARGEA